MEEEKKISLNLTALEKSPVENDLTQNEEIILENFESQESDSNSTQLEKTSPEESVDMISEEKISLEEIPSPVKNIPEESSINPLSSEKKDPEESPNENSGEFRGTKISLASIKKSQQEPKKTEPVPAPETKNEETSPGQKTEILSSEEKASEIVISQENTNLPLVEESSSVETENALLEQNPAPVSENLEIAQAQKPEKKSFFSFFKKKQKNTETPENSTTQNTNPETPKEVHFQNYTSVFQKESENIINKIRKFGYAPKTRVGMVVSLIFLTLGVIASLFVFLPEKHNLETYKAFFLAPFSENTPTEKPPVETEPPVDDSETQEPPLVSSSGAEDIPLSSTGTENTEEDTDISTESSTGAEIIPEILENSNENSPGVETIPENPKQNENHSNIKIESREKLKNYIIEKYSNE